MKKIPLIKGKYAIVDDEDYPYLNRFHWYLSGSKWKGVVRDLKFVKEKIQERIFMPYFVIENKPGNIITHMNGNILDNRKENLKSVSLKVMSHRGSKRKNVSSKFKGVCWDKENNLWRATIKYNERWHSLGRFSNEKQAAVAYNKKAKELYGELAYQNLIK